MIRKLLVVTVTCLSTVVLAGTAVAGGWAVTTIDETPGEFEVGVTHEVVYSIFQHGRTAVEDATTSLIFEQEGGEPLDFAGVPTGTPGQYVAEVELPSPGTWTWSAEQGFFGPFQLGTIEVAESSIGSWSTRAVMTVLLPIVAVAALALFISRARSAQASSPNSAPASSITSRM